MMEAVARTPFIPPEVWCSIFSYLEEPKDLLNAVRTPNAPWEDAMISRKPAYYLMNVFPFIFKYLESSEVIYLRRVCKKLEITIDKYLENSYCLTDPGSYSPGRYNFNSTKVNVHMPNYLVEIYNFALPPTTFPNSPNISMFLDKFGSFHCGNPFIGRHIKIAIRGPPFSHQPYYERAKEMLTQFGKELRELTFHVAPISVSLEAISHLRTLLSFVPNLQALRIQWGGEINSMQQEDNYPLQYDLDPVSPEEILESLRSSPFPPLKDLTTLNISCEYCVHAYSNPLGLFFLQTYGNQVRNLICYENFFDGGHKNSLLPNLKNLRVFDVSTSSIQQLSKVKCNLERLQFNNTFESISPPPTLSDMLDVINNFASTLVHLEINTQLKCTWSDALDLSQDWEIPLLPNLKFLSTALGNTSSTWFCEMIKHKCQNLTLLEFQTHLYMESIMIYMNKEKRREYAQRHLRIMNWFHTLPKLEKVRFQLGTDYPFDFHVVNRQNNI